MLSKSNSDTLLRRIISSIVLGAFLINTIFSEVSFAAPLDPSAQTLSQAAVTLDPHRAVSLLAESYRRQDLLWTPRIPKHDDLLTRYGADALLLPAGKYLVKPELLSKTSDLPLVRAITLEDFKVLLGREWRDHGIRLTALKDRITGDQSIMSAYSKLPLSKALSGHDPRVIFNDIITRAFEIRALITGHLIQVESNPLSGDEMNFYAALKDALEKKDRSGAYTNFSSAFYDNSERMRSVLGIRKPKSFVIAGAMAAEPEEEALGDIEELVETIIEISYENQDGSIDKKAMEAIRIGVKGALAMLSSLADDMESAGKDTDIKSELLRVLRIVSALSVLASDEHVFDESVQLEMESELKEIVNTVYDVAGDSGVDFPDRESVLAGHVFEHQPSSVPMSPKIQKTRPSEESPDRIEREEALESIKKEIGQGKYMAALATYFKFPTRDNFAYLRIICESDAAVLDKITKELDRLIEWIDLSLVVLSPESDLSERLEKRLESAKELQQQLAKITDELKKNANLPASPEALERRVRSGAVQPKSPSDIPKGRHKKTSYAKIVSAMIAVFVNFTITALTSGSQGAVMNAPPAASILPKAPERTALSTTSSREPVIQEWAYTQYPSGRMESKRNDTPDEYGKVYYHFIDENYYGRGYGRVDVDVLATNDSSGAIAYSYEYDDAVSYDVAVGDGSTRVTNGVTHAFVGFGGASHSSIQAAVDETYDAGGGMVIVRGGTYDLNNSQITLKDGVRMMGGYAQDGTRDITASPTILEDGYIDAIGPVTQDTGINGFTIDSGTHARRHLIGVDTRGGTGRILLMNNTLRARTNVGFGIEVVGDISQATIFNNDISATDDGKFYWAGVHVADGAWVTMEFNRISTHYGAGVVVNGSIVPSKAVIRNNLFTDNGLNPASRTHSLLFDAFSTRVWDNTFFGADEAVAYKDSEDTKIENNIATDQEDAAIWRIGSGTATENGNIVGSGLDPADYPDKGYSPQRIYIDYDSRGYTKTGYAIADITNPSNPILTNPVLSYEYDASGLFNKQTNYDGTYSLYVDHWQDTGNVKKRLDYSSTNELLFTTEYWTDGYSALSIINHVTGRIDEWLSGDIYRQLVPSNGTYHAYTYKGGRLIVENDPVYGVKVFNYDTNWNGLGYTRYYDNAPTNGLGTRVREECDSSWRLIKKYVWDRPFHTGVNLPWLDYGKDIGRSRALVSEPIQRGFSTKREELDENLRQLAGSVSRPFVLCDLRSGIQIDGRGNITGFDEQTASDLRELLNSAQANGVKLILTIFDYTIAEGVIGAKYDMWYGPITEPLGEYPQFITDASKREQLKDAVLALFDKVEMGKYSCVIGLDLMNEPEWARDGLDYGMHPWNVYDPNWSGGVPQADLESFFDYFTDALKAAYPDKWITVGHKDREELSGWSGTNDLYQFHYYDWMAYDPAHLPLEDVDAGDLGLDGPVFAGELDPTGATTKLRMLYDGGYSMGLFWRDNSGFPMFTNTLNSIKNYFIGTVYEYDGNDNITNTYHVDGEVIEPANKTTSVSGLLKSLFVFLGVTFGLRRSSRDGPETKPFGRIVPRQQVDLPKARDDGRAQSDAIAGAMAEAGNRINNAAALKGTNEMLWDWNFRIYMLLHKRSALKAAGRGTGNVKRSLATVAGKMESALPFVAEILSAHAVNKIRDAVRLVDGSNEPAANMNLTSIFPEVMAMKAANSEERIKTESGVERVFYRNGAWYVREQRHRYSDKWKTSVLVYVYQRYDTLWEAFRAVDHQIDSELGETQYLSQCRSIIGRINDPSFTDKSGLSEEIEGMRKRLGRVRIEEKKLARSVLMAGAEIIKYGGTEQTAGLLRIAYDLFEKRAKESDAIAAGLAEKRISVLRKELKRKNDYLLEKADKILHDLNYGNHGLTEMIISEDLRTPEGLRYMNEPDMAILNRSLEVIAGRFVRGPPREADMESLKRFFRLFHRRVIDSMVVGNLMAGYRDKFIEDYRKSGGDLATARSKAFEEEANGIIAKDRNAKKDPETYYKMFRQAAFIAPKTGKPGEKIPNPEFTAISDDVIRREAEEYGIKPLGVALLVSAPPAGSRSASDSIAGAMAEDEAQTAESEVPQEMSRHTKEEILRILEEGAARDPELEYRIARKNFRLGVIMDMLGFIKTGVAPIRIIKDKKTMPNYAAFIDKLNPSNYIVLRIEYMDDGNARVSVVGDDKDAMIAGVGDGSTPCHFGSLKAGRVFYERLATRGASCIKTDRMINAGVKEGILYSHISLIRDPEISVNLVSVEGPAQDRRWLTPGSGYEHESAGKKIRVFLVDTKKLDSLKPHALPGAEDIAASSGKFVAYPAEGWNADEWLRIRQGDIYEYFQNIGVREEAGIKSVIYSRIDKEDRIAAIEIASDRRTFYIEGLELDGKPLALEAGHVNIGTLLFLLSNDNVREIGRIPAYAQGRITISDSLKTLACTMPQIVSQTKAKIPTKWRTEPTPDGIVPVLCGYRTVSWLSKWGEEAMERSAIEHLGPIRRTIMDTIPEQPEQPNITRDGSETKSSDRIAGAMAEDGLPEGLTASARGVSPSDTSRTGMIMQGDIAAVARSFRSYIGSRDDAEAKAAAQRAGSLLADLALSEEGMSATPAGPKLNEVCVKVAEELEDKGVLLAFKNEVIRRRSFVTETDSQRGDSVKMLRPDGIAPSEAIAGAMAEDGPPEELIASASGASQSDTSLKARNTVNMRDFENRISEFSVADNAAKGKRDDLMDIHVKNKLSPAEAFKALSEQIAGNPDALALNTEVSKLGGNWQDISANSMIRLVIPVEVLKDCSDIALAFKRLGLSGADSPRVKLVVTGASEEDAKLFEALDSSAGARKALDIPANVAISVIRESEIAQDINDPHTLNVVRLMGVDVNDPELRVDVIKKIALRLAPLERGEYMAIATSGVDSGRMHETIERLQGSYLVEDNVSILLLEKPDPSKSAYSLSKMLRMWAADIRRGETSNICIILPVLISPKEMLERLGASLRTAWQILTAA